MATNRYSLADYTVVVTFDTTKNINTLNSLRATSLYGEASTVLASGENSITLGGPGATSEGLGSFLGSIRVSRNKDLWTTDGDSTGSWVHNKDLNRTGNVAIELNQISDDTIKLDMLCRAYQNENTDTDLYGATINIYSMFSTSPIVSCRDCYIKKHPDLDLGNSAANRTFEFTCGQVNYYK